jgi:hypothetical protein
MKPKEKTLMDEWKPSYLFIAMAFALWLVGTWKSDPITQALSGVGLLLMAQAFFQAKRIIKKKEKK